MQFPFVRCLSLALLLSGLSYANAARADSSVTIDFGAFSLNSNKINQLSTPSGGSISNLVDGNGQPSGISVSITEKFGGINTGGTTSPPGSLGFTAPMTSASFFGNSAAFNGSTFPVGQFQLKGLSLKNQYSFVLYASRMNSGDNRETQYTVTGANSGVALLNVANNISGAAVIHGIVPNPSGSITITVQKGPHNTNANGFFYVGIAKMTPSPLSVTPSPSPSPTPSPTPVHSVTPPPPSGTIGAQASIPTYTGRFEYGFNPGYYGSGFTDDNLYQMGADLNSHTTRSSMPDNFLLQYGPQVRTAQFQYFANTLGFKSNTLFVGIPGNSDRETTQYVPGVPSQMWAGMYLPIWKDEANKVVNPNNKLAVYLSTVAQNYGAYVQFWEIVNEPDFTYNTSIAYAPAGSPGSWWTNMPKPSDMTNLAAPTTEYIRALRVAYTVIKKFYPNSYVGPGGIGYASFLDCILRYSDNPNGGAITADYPATGGAYMDMVSWHVYPEYLDAYWDNATNGFIRERHSDRLMRAVTQQQAVFDDVLRARGYDGGKYPKKYEIVTESNVSRKQIGVTGTGGIDLQKNYAIKALVHAQRLGVLQWYWFSLGENEDYATATNPFGMEGLYQNLTKIRFGQQTPTTEGIANKTTSELLYEKPYNAGLSAQLNLPANVDGAAFGSGSNVMYVLWAKTSVDMSEAASATYTFPAAVKSGTLVRYEWNHATTGTTATVNSVGISLSAAPSFFKP